MKTKLLLLSLLLVFIPGHASADSVLKQISKPVTVQTTIGKPVKKEPLVPPVMAQMDFQPYAFSPIGTYPTPYPSGQCTAGAASAKGNVPSWGNANQWDDRARAAGIPVSDIPIIGSIAVDNSGYYGHVAVVEEVNRAAGMVEVEEMNYDWNGGVRSYWYPISHFQDYIWM